MLNWVAVNHWLSNTSVFRTDYELTNKPPKADIPLHLLTFLLTPRVDIMTCMLHLYNAWQRISDIFSATSGTVLVPFLHFTYFG